MGTNFETIRDTLAEHGATAPERDTDMLAALIDAALNAAGPAADPAPADRPWPA
jgi:hypothetical protein